MFLLSNLLNAIATVLNGVLQLYLFITIARALISWVNPDPRNPIVRFLRAATDPLLNLVRRHIPIAVYSGIDFSPIIVIFAIYFLQAFLVQSIYDAAAGLR